MDDTVPGNLEYTAEHDWVRRETDGQFTVGITRHAADALGDVVHVDLPAVGLRVAAGDLIGEIESTKSVSDLAAPLAGEINAVNPELDSRVELVNTDPYGAGWLYRIQAEGAQIELLRPADYAALIGDPQS